MATGISQMPARLKGQTTCIHHKDRQLDFYCEKCEEPICAKCLSFVHKGHFLCELSEITPKKEPAIKNFIERTEENELVQVGKYIASTDILLKENATTFDKLSQKLKIQSEKLKKQLDLLSEQTLSVYRQLEEDNTKLITKYKQDLQTYEKQLKQQVWECKSALQRGSHKEVEEWKSPCHIHSICPTTDGQLWTTFENKLTLLDRKGTVVQEVIHESAEINDITVSPTTKTLWICDGKNSISEMVSGRLIQRFSTKEVPRCIRITAGNHVIVGIIKFLCKFTTDGKIVCTTMVAGTGRLCAPDKISECPVTQNVAVADEKQRVVVMDSDFNELFVYRGDMPSLFKPRQAFSPIGVVYDSVGNLIIGDLDSCMVLLISGGGEFLRVIHTDTNKDYTRTLGVDKEDVVWAMFGGLLGNIIGIHKVKLLQYTSV